MHPNYRAMAGGGPYAHPYACSEYLFSDESAALYRAELGLPPLEPYCPLRPSVVLTGKSGGIVGYEHEVAEQVALLQSKGELPPTPATAMPAVSAEPPTSARTSFKRSRDSDILSDDTLALTTRPSRDTSSSSPVGADDSSRRRSTSIQDKPRHPSSVPSASDDVSAEPPSGCSPAVQAPKRRKTSNSPSSSPIACSAPPSYPKCTLRTSPEPLKPTSKP